MAERTQKVEWVGKIVSVQPRIRMTRSFDQRYHDYLGYVLTVEGICDDEGGVFMIAVGKAAHAKHRFRVGMEASGRAVPVPDSRYEIAGFYKVSGLAVLSAGAAERSDEPPFHGAPPELPTYRERGHLRLDPRTYKARCSTCIWGCRMPVEMIIDHWNPSKKEYRFETFCYGPKSCSYYRAGKPRNVPGRKGVVFVEEDWVDEIDTEHRGPDD